MKFLVIGIILLPLVSGSSWFNPMPQVEASPTLTPTATTTPQPELQGDNPPAIDGVSVQFPTPGLLPVTAWRPPLYPIPWAQTEYDHFLFARPIAADVINWPLADYRYGGVYFAPDVVHTGVDIDAPSNTPVLAAAEGTVVWADYGLFTTSEGNRSDPYGLAVAIRHDFGFQGQRLYTIYAHLSSTSVTNGQVVQLGDVLGAIGETGHVTGPHLHFEVRLGKNDFFSTRNPELWMSPPQGWGVLAARIADKKDKTLTHVNMIIYSYATRQEWEVRTYGPVAVNPDDGYHENLVLSDLPAGKYNIYYRYADRDFYGKFEIYPGQVTFVHFLGEKGFKAGMPTPVFTPKAATPSP